MKRELKIHWQKSRYFVTSFFTCIVVLLTYNNCEQVSSPKKNTGGQIGSPAVPPSTTSKYLYDYAPSLIEADGKKYMWTCSNRPTPGDFRDVVSLFIDGVYSGTAVPHGTSLTQWDGVHACDPSVIQGDFKYKGENYQYLMAYLGEDENDANGDGKVTCDSKLCEFSMHNQVGFAVSKSLTGPWTKYPRPLVTFESRYYWGVGQPSVLRLPNGNILMAYTRGEQYKTSSYFKVFDFSDFDDSRAPEQVGQEIEFPTSGLTSGKNFIMIRNADLALDSLDENIYMVRGTEYDEQVQVAVMPLQDFLSRSGQWSVIRDITQELTGFRNHNAGLLRTADGHLPDDRTLGVYVTMDPGTPTNPENPRIEWDYKITPYNISLATTEEAVTVVAPQNASQVLESRPTFTWEYHGLGTMFKIELSEDPAFAWSWSKSAAGYTRALTYDGSTWDKTANAPYQAPTALAVGKTYYLRITPSADGSPIASSASAVTSFTMTSNAAEVAVQVISPQNNSSTFNINPTISWSYQGGATDFWIDLSESPSFAWFWNKNVGPSVRSFSYSGTGWGKTTNAPDIAPGSLVRGKRYYLRVTPFNNGSPISGSGAQSSFEVK